MIPTTIQDTETARMDMDPEARMNSLPMAVTGMDTDLIMTNPACCTLENPLTMK